ncbi:sialidase family protein, partial [Streptomyces mirabilis]
MSARLRARLRSTLTAVLTAAALCVLALPSPARASATDASGGSGASGASGASGGSGASFEQQVLFRASQDPGYACFRIPAVVRSTHGTLLAFAEGRVHDCGDAGDIDIVVKRSTDGGRTWGPLQVVNEGAGDTHGNPAPIVDRETGRIVLAETYNTGRTDGRGCDVPCDRTPHLQYSDDDGLSWSAPRDLSAEILPPNWNSWYATGPVHGIQLTRGRHAGRLVFGVNTETWNGSRVTANNAALITSDDGGDHWRIGASDSWPIAEDGTFRQKPSELTLTERADGSVLVSGREQDGTDLGHRTQTVSRDGGDSFTAPFRDLPGLYAPQVQGSVLRLGDRVLLACPGDPDRRRTMMIRSSYDGGRTWDSVDRGTVVTTDWSGYSDLVAIGGG